MNSYMAKKLWKKCSEVTSHLILVIMLYKEKALTLIVFDQQ